MDDNELHAQALFDHKREVATARLAGIEDGVAKAGHWLIANGHETAGQRLLRGFTMMVPARLDVDRAAKPLTEIRGVTTVVMVRDGSTIMRRPEAYLFRDTPAPLTGPELAAQHGFKPHGRDPLALASVASHCDDEDFEERDSGASGDQVKP